MALIWVKGCERVGVSRGIGEFFRGCGRSDKGIKPAGR